MAILEQLSDEYKVINGWYGKCHDSSGELVELESCPEYDLNSATAQIRSVYWIKSDNTIETFNAGADAGLQDFTSLKCGAAYLIYLQKGTGNIDIPNFVASYSDTALQGRITNSCDTGGASFTFEVKSEPITETLDEGYQFEGSSEFDSGSHTGIITSITDTDNVTIKASGNNLQFSLNGSDWTNITTNAQTINANFTNLQIRTNLGLSNRTISRTITLEATPSNNAFQNITKTINYTSTINNVALSASKDIDEVIEAGSTGAEYSFDVSYENLKSIAIAGGSSSGYQVSTTSGSGFENSLTLENTTLTSSPIKIYVKLTSAMPESSVSNVLSVTGKRRTSEGDIVLTNAVTADATVAPRPQIATLSVNPTTLKVTATFTNRNNYGGTHWHYEVIKKSDNSSIISNQRPQFNSEVIMNQSEFEDAGAYILKAFIANDSHNKIPGSNDKQVEFIIAANNATLSLNKYAINDVLDKDDNIISHTVTITSNNLTNITLSPDGFTNWEVTSSSANSFVIKLKNAVKLLDLSSGPKTLAHETITVTGDVGDRDTSGDAQKTASVTLDAKIVDDAEFTITPPSGQSNTITDNRNYGSSVVEFGPYTINGDAVTLSATTLNHWEVEIDDSETWTKNPSFSGEGESTFKLRQSKTSVGDAYNDSLVITPTAKDSDHDVSDDPSAVTLTLNGKIIPLVANLNNPGTQTLNSITSGESSESKTFTVTGTRIQNITISEVSTGWSVTPTSPALNGVVTVAYTGDEVTSGTKSGTFKISAEAITGSVLSTTEYEVDLRLVVAPKISKIYANPGSVSLDAITTGESSNSKSTEITSDNLSDIKITQIPSGFIVKNGTTLLSTNDTIGTTATLNITISDVNTLGARSGTIKLTGTPTANSEFNGSNVKNISVSAQVNGLPTTLNANPTTITDAVNQYEATPSAHKITITEKDNLQSIVVTGGNASKYQVSATQGGAYTNSVTLESSAVEFWVKLMSTATQPQIKTTFTVSGVKTALGASNPASKSVVCTATVTAFEASLTLDPTSLSEEYDQGAEITATKIDITKSNINSIQLNASGEYQISATEDGSYGTTLSMGQYGSSFYVKLKSTATAGVSNGSVSVVGSHTLGGGNTTRTLSCSAVITAPEPAADFFSFENDTGSTIDLVFDFSVIDKLEHDGVVGSIQARFDGISATGVKGGAILMQDPELAYGNWLGGSSLFNFNVSNSIVVAWANVGDDAVQLNPPVEKEDAFEIQSWMTNTKAKFRLNYTSKSTITFNDSYDHFAQAPAGSGIRKYTINIDGSVLIN